jgi:CheY-like chemotaxis protein
MREPFVTDEVMEESTIAGSAADILVVDDLADNLRVLGHLLSSLGYGVRTASSGVAALAAAQSQPPDLVLLDVMMPEMDGFAVLSRWRQDDEMHDVPVIIISGVDDTASVVRGIEMGAEDYLSKPFDAVLLRARISACLEKKEWRDREKQCQQRIEAERNRADALLHAILPAPIAEELKATGKVKPRLHENVAILFVDVVDFTRHCETHSPESLIGHLQELVEVCEQASERHGLQKIKTVGDAFMGAAGLFEQTDNPIMDSVRAALEILEISRGLSTRWQLRIGMHIGPVIAGIVGHRQYLFDVWGDTVNTAQRVASHGAPGSVNLSRAAWQWVSQPYQAELLSSGPVKGKGNLEIMQIAIPLLPSPDGACERGG